MAIRPELRWLVITALIVAVLLGISALAMDRPNVVWSGQEPHCPACREPVRMHATRCTECSERFDWTPLPDEQSPISPFSLSSIEDAWVRARLSELGAEEAQRRVAQVLHMDEASAAKWLEQFGRGRCGWCGGSGLELPAAEADADDETPCRVCGSRGACIGCGGDRRVRIDDPEAGRSLEHLLRALADLERAERLDPEAVAAERRREIEAFLDRHAGTLEAWRMPFVGALPEGVPAAPPEEIPAGAQPESAVVRARQRLQLVLDALARDGS